jgi:ferritin-like metal-binding protein YciE
MADLPAGSAKLVQYLNEAYGLERRLETALQAQLALATRTAYKQRLRAHLKETKAHGREVAKRIKKLGGKAETVDLPGPDAISDVAKTAVAGAQRAVALAQGPLHALRGTGEEEKQLKNAKTAYASESEEIATYSAIRALAEALGDGETAKLAKAILREEERMRSFLEKEIPRMVKSVIKEEVPRTQRAPRKKASKAARPKAAPSKPASAGKPTAAGTARKTAARKPATAAKPTVARKATARKSAPAAAGKSRATGKPPAARKPASSRSTKRAKVS